MPCPPPGSKRDGAPAGGPEPAVRREPRRFGAAPQEPRCALCGGPWRDLGHCKGVCLRCGFMQSCVDTI